MKILCLIFTICLLLCMFWISVQSYDINLDGQVNAIDCVYVIRGELGMLHLNWFQKLRADVNRDGVIDGQDADIIGQYILHGGN